MTDDVSSPLVRNKFSELAFRATIINLVSWLLLAIPGFLQSIWSISLMVTIPLSTIIAVIAGTIGAYQEKASGKGAWKSFAGIFVGMLSLIMIVISLIGIYAMVNAP